MSFGRARIFDCKIDKVIDISRVSERMILTTTFVQDIFVSLMSVHVPWCFTPQPSLISVAGKFAEKGVVIIARLQ